MKRYISLKIRSEETATQYVSNLSYNSQ